ncbi:MAG: hypothetical protein IH586_05370, partial [Anaerolineaceae bacterium]|nr:hypothetical protein [Anaerolineaceae bacterium]
LPLGIGLLVILVTGGLYAAKGVNPLGIARQSPGYGKKLFFPYISKITPPPAPNKVPLPTDSYYFWMKYYTDERARAEGCKLGIRDRDLAGTQNNLVILDFGITKYQNGQYGASGMSIGGFYTMAQIANAVEQFSIGYWICTGSDYNSHLLIGIGTNNYNDSSVYSNLSVTYGHGREWAVMVNSVNDWLKNGCPDSCNGQVSAAGANDIELAWSSPAAAIDWLDGYDSVNLYPMINFGAAEGCPNACGGGGYYWTKDQVWRVQNSGPVYSLPEIYLNDGRNAQQWYQMSVYSKQKYGKAYDFIGVMTTYGACQQSPGDTSCPYIDNTPAQGWTQLYNLVNGSDMSTWDSIPFVTDIRWWE